jgi:phosphoribosylamine--glycine ligase
MRFAFVSHDGSGLPFWLRVKDEGHEVKSYVPNRGTSFLQRDNGKGLIDRAGSWNELMAWGMSRPGTVFVFDFSTEGKLAEQLRQRGQLVVGGGLFCDQLELDRTFGEDIASSCGVLAPATHKFPSISATIAFLKKHDQDWYFKADGNLSTASTAHGEPEKLIRRLKTLAEHNGDQIKNILQETIEGADISTACWWNGRDWIGPFEGTIENKKLMDGNVGPSTGCSFNVVWFYEGWPTIANELKFREMGELFRKHNAPAGVYDINAMISEKDGHAYFLEYTPRFGYDAEPTAMRAIQGELAQFYYDLATGRATHVPFDTSRAQMSVRVTVQPYPWENLHELPSPRRKKASGAVGVSVGQLDGSDLRKLYGGGGEHFMAYGCGLGSDGELVVVDTTGIVGLVCADGFDTELMNDEILEEIEELDIADAQYRTDAGQVLDEHLEKIKSLGYDTGVL